jgi:hypothetical protein
MYQAIVRGLLSAKHPNDGGSGHVYAVLGVFLLGFGSMGLGWLLSHAGDKADHPGNTSDGRTVLAYIFYGLGFLISNVGGAMALEVANNPGSYGIH